MDVTNQPANPSDTDICIERKSQIRRLRIPPLEDRADFLCSLVKGKSVLDVGAVQHSADAMHSPDWLHRRLRESAAECLGVDILPEDVARLQSAGFNIQVVDIVKRPLDRTFDAIVCGELIEHIDEAGCLLANIRQMMTESSILLLTTPNPWYINTVAEVFNTGIYCDNTDHVAWYDPVTLAALGERHGLALQRYAGIRVKTARTRKGKVFFRLASLATRCGLDESVFCKTILYEFSATHKH